MEIKLIHILGPVLATVAMLFYGNLMVRRQYGRRINVFPTLAMVMGAILFRQFTGDGTFLDRICLTLLDFGIAMIIDSGYLKAKKAHPKVFWVPGVLALIVSFGLYFMASLFGWTVNGMFDESDPVLMEEVLVELGPDDDISELEDVLSDFDAEWEKAFPNIDLDEDEDLAQYFIVRVPKEKEAEFLTEVRKDTENVDSAEENTLVSLDDPAAPKTKRRNKKDGFYTNDPGISNQWWLPQEKANSIHELLKNNKPKKKAIVAIVDTGVDSKHEDLKSVMSGKQGKRGDKDKQGHGTHCAGLAGASTNNKKGIASLNWEGKFIEIRGYKALNDNGTGTMWQVAKAITQAAEDKADVISLSLGSHGRAPKVQRDAIEFAHKQGCIVVAAAGNSYGDDAKNHAPANVDGVIVVSAVAKDMSRSHFSNVNTSLDYPIAAPGSEIYSTFPDGEYKFLNGTSMATPLVSGLLGIVRSYQPNIKAKDAYKLINANAQEVPASSSVGKVIDPLKTIEALVK